MADFLTENTTDFLDLDSFNARYGQNIRQSTFEKLTKSITDEANKIGISLECAEIHCNPRQSILGHVATSRLKGGGTSICGDW